MIIYMATNKVNGKMYIGQTINSLDKRRGEHTSVALTKNNNYFHSAIRKYCADNFDWTILHDDITNIDLLNRLEIFYIGYYDTFENGYNLNTGGRNAIHSEESKRKMSESQLGEKNHMYGRRGKNSPNYGKHFSEERRKKISKALKGKYCGEDSSWYGKKHSKVSLKKMSVSTKGNYVGKNNPNANVIIINNKYFDTRDEAAEFVGVHSTTIRRRILHKTKWMDYQYA